MDSSMCRGQALLSPTWKPSTRGLRLVLSHTARDPDPPVWRPRCSQGGDTASMLPVDVQAKLYLATGISDGQRGIGMLQGTRNLLPGYLGDQGMLRRR